MPWLQSRESYEHSASPLSQVTRFKLNILNRLKLKVEGWRVEGGASPFQKEVVGCFIYAPTLPFFSHPFFSYPFSLFSFSPLFFLSFFHLLFLVPKSLILKEMVIF